MQLASNNTTRAVQPKSLEVGDILEAGTSPNFSQRGTSIGAGGATKNSKKDILVPQLPNASGMTYPPNPAQRTLDKVVAKWGERGTKKQKQTDLVAGAIAQLSNAAEDVTLSTPTVVLENKQFWSDEQTMKKFKVGLHFIATQLYPQIDS